MDTKTLIFLDFVSTIPILAIFFSAFQRWLQHKERIGEMIANQIAEKAAQYASHVERIEAFASGGANCS